MDLDHVWKIFIDQLTKNQYIEKAHWVKVAGIPFLYIQTIGNVLQDILEKEILKSSAYAMKGYRLHCETVYVRKEELLYVYRHRFLVPQEKMFCCGNLCKDCIRFKEN